MHKFLNILKKLGEIADKKFNFIYEIHRFLYM